MKVFFESQKLFLEQLFGTDWFAKNVRRNSNHPAMGQWLFCYDRIRRGGELSFPIVSAEIRKTASLLLDFYVMSESSARDPSKFGVGGLKNYADEKVKARIKAIIFDPKQFNSLMTELSLAAWCISNNYQVTAYEDLGFPDFRLSSDNLDLPILVECKNIEPCTSLNRLATIVKKANKQIKKVGIDCYGVIFINVTNLVKHEEEFGDTLPADVVRIIEKLKKALSQFNSAVSSAIIFWDQYFVKSQGADKTLCHFTRKSFDVAHKNPTNFLPRNLQLLKFGLTIMFAVERKAQHDTKRIVFGATSFRRTISRNSLCSCGSERRFKVCCGKLT